MKRRSNHLYRKSIYQGAMVGLGVTSVLVPFSSLASLFPPILQLSSLTNNGNHNGFVINGITGRAGRAVSGAGDVNGDGIDDVIIGADYVNNFSGQSYVIFGQSNGFISPFELSTLTNTNPNGFAINGIGIGDRSGRSVSDAGDVNGDGIDDLVIGAPFSNVNGSSSGQSYVIFGKKSVFNSPLQLSSLNGADGFIINGITTNDFLGIVSSAGDVNGDGIDDLIMGASDASPNGITTAGQSYVIFGKDSGFGSPLELFNLTNSDPNGFVINGINVSDYSGDAVSGAGDVNGDGIDDFVIGAFGGDPDGKIYAGQSYVVFGRTNGFVSPLELSSLNGTNGFIINGITADDYAGNSVSGAGDVNGDGIDDLVIGASYANPNGNNSGQSYVLFGKKNGFPSPFELSTLTNTNPNGFAINGISTEHYSGYVMSSAGDVNGDGVDDLIIGAPNADPNGNNSGQSYVVFGTMNGFVSPLELSDLNGVNGFKISGINPDDQSSRSVSGAGDVNGDGVDDLIIGASYADPNGISSGQSYVVFGRPIPLADFNGDGRDDVLLKKKRTLSILTASSSGSNSPFGIQSLTPTLIKKQRKVVAANDLSLDGKPEVIVQEKKSYQILTVETNLSMGASSYPLPSLSKGFKITASGAIRNKRVVIASKKNLISVLGNGFSGTLTNKSNYQPLGLGKVGRENVLFLLRAKELHKVSVNLDSNGLSFGGISTIGKLPKGQKAIGMGKISEGAVDTEVIVQKKNEVGVLKVPNYSTVIPIGTVNKGQKVVGPR